MSHIFAGLKVPEHITMKLKKWSDYYESKIPLKQWTHPEDYHITLAFLGSAEKGQLDQLKKSLTEIALESQRFSLNVEGIGSFGRPKTPRVLWVGLHKEIQLFDLQKKVQLACIAAGYHLDERSYNPHITLGKKWEGSTPVELDNKNNELTHGELAWSVEDFRIFEIHPQKSPKYNTAEIYTLQ
jgi:2'-5' RNA ligase